MRKQMAQLDIDSKGVDAMYADLPFTLAEDKANALYVADYGDEATDTNLGLRHTINVHPIFQRAMVKKTRSGRTARRPTCTRLHPWWQASLPECAAGFEWVNVPAWQESKKVRLGYRSPCSKSRHMRMHHGKAPACSPSGLGQPFALPCFVQDRRRTVPADLGAA